MKILYVSSLCSDVKFKEIFENSIIKPQQQAQKFHKLLSEGFSRECESIHFITRPPINSTTKINKDGIKSTEIIGNKRFEYLTVSNNRYLRHIKLFLLSLFHVLKWNYTIKTSEKVIICDILNLSISIPVLIAAKFLRIKTVAIVTDLPNYMINSKRKEKSIKWVYLKFYTTICSYFLKQYDYYVILTEQMNNLVNPKNKPYLVIEGMVDKEMKRMNNHVNDKYKEKIIIYAGALHEKYGIKKLTDAFIELKNPHVRLWLFGDGDFTSQINSYEEKDNRIKYFGVVSNEFVVKEQLKATLLINPRPSDEGFTKYSFPSKNMEYMASGTPVITTQLPGMPIEYRDYVYTFEDETVKGMTKTLASILSKKETELYEKGNRAKEFVLKEKNNLVQTKKMIKMIKKE